ncbi:MAG: cytochrome c [Verrucomicrobiota bacterium]
MKSICLKTFSAVWGIVILPLIGFTQTEEGDKLYKMAGSCVACHMPNGEGQPGSIPPLADSDWLKDENATPRLIAMTLRGMAGPIKVNGKKYFSAMPPQVLFNDEQLATLLTHVRDKWGKKGDAITPEEIAKARAADVGPPYTPLELLRTYPFPRDMARNNGLYELEEEKAIDANITAPVIARTFMPGATPAAFAVALPGGHNFCWDAGECRLRYAWSKGGFIRNNKRHWSSNGKPVAEYEGTPYYLARSSHIKPEDTEKLARVDIKEPIYDSTQATDFPFEIKGEKGLPEYLGYRLVEGHPEFIYQLGSVKIHEKITSTEQLDGIIRHFKVEPATAISLNLTASDDCETINSHGSIGEEGALNLSASDSEAFTITHRELNTEIQEEKAK